MMPSKANRHQRLAVKFVNPVIRFAEENPLLALQGDLIISQAGSEYAISWHGTTRCHSGLLLEITTPLTVKIAKSGAPLFPMESFDDLCQTWKQFHLEIGKGQISSIDQDAAKTSLFSLDHFEWGITHQGSTEKVSNYAYASTGKAILLPFFDPTLLTPYLSELVQNTENKAAAAFFAGVEKGMVKAEPYELERGAIDFSTKGSFTLPTAGACSLLCSIASVNPAAALRQTAEAGHFLNHTMDYEDKLYAYQGNLSLRTLMADQKPRLMVQCQTESKLSASCIEQYLKGLTDVVMNALSVQDSLQSCPAEASPSQNTHETITAAMHSHFDFKETWIPKNISVNLNGTAAQLGGGLSCAIELQELAGLPKGKITLKLANYETMIDAAAAFYNKNQGRLFDYKDQTGQSLVITSETVAASKKLLKAISNHPAKSGKNLEITLTFDAKNNKKAMIGKMPLDQALMLFNMLIASKTNNTP